MFHLLCSYRQDKATLGVKWIRRNEHLDSWNAIVRMCDEFREDICFPFQLCHLLQCSLFISKEQSWHGTKCNCITSPTHTPTFCFEGGCFFLTTDWFPKGDRSVKSTDVQPAVRMPYVGMSVSVRVFAATNLYVVEFFYYPRSQAWVSIRTGDVQVLNHTKKTQF